MSDEVQAKTDREILILLHEKVAGRGGLVDRVETMETKVSDLQAFKIKVATIAALIGAGIGTLGSTVLNWLKGPPPTH